MEIWSNIFDPEFLYSIIRISTPLIFATLAAYIAGKSGLFNMAIEGIMLISALMGVFISAWTGNIVLTFFIVSIIGIALGLILGALVMKLETDILMTGLGINIIATGLTVFLMYIFIGDKGATSSLISLQLPQITIPIINKIPVIGTIFSNHNMATYLAFICAIALYLFIYKTKTGLRIRAVGENYQAAQSVGIKVNKMRYIALGLSGLFASFGGMYLSMGYLTFFVPSMTAGRGFIGLAADAMSGGSILIGVVVSIFFGAFDALANLLQVQASIPVEFIFIIPYAAVIVALVIYNINKRRKIIKKKIAYSVNNQEAIDRK